MALEFPCDIAILRPDKMQHVNDMRRSRHGATRGKGHGQRRGDEHQRQDHEAITTSESAISFSRPSQSR